MVLLYLYFVQITVKMLFDIYIRHSLFYTCILENMLRTSMCEVHRTYASVTDHSVLLAPQPDCDRFVTQYT